MTPSHRTPRSSPPPASRRHAGFALLAVLLVIGALALMVGVSLQASEGSRSSSAQAQHETAALHLAEAGLEQTRTYLEALLLRYPDLDLALDPKGDTQCMPLPNPPTVNVDDDNRPNFAGGTRVQFPPGSGRFYTFMPLGGGGYLVRIDDNEDDALVDALTNTTNNTVGAFCNEGGALNNPLRDRDRSVTVTAIGVYPLLRNTSTNPAELEPAINAASARRVLRVRFGQRATPGIIAGGDIRMNGSSHVCGAFGSVSTTRNLDGTGGGGCLCGAGCNGGPARQRCDPGNTCTAQAGQGTCNADFGGAVGGVCLPNANVPPPPKVEVWSSLNAPPRCTTAPCIPFYYLRKPSAGSVEVFMWDYARTVGATSCEDPQSFDRIYRPGETAPPGSCWGRVYDGNICDPNSVKILNEVSLTARTPAVTTPCASAPIVWTHQWTGDFTGSCGSTSTLYPSSSGVYGPHYLPGDTFRYQTSGSVIPRGVWFIEGNITFETDTPGFTGAGPLAVPVTLLVIGNVLVDKKAVHLTPAHPRGVTLLAGRDLEVRGGNGMLWTCGDPSNPASMLNPCPSAAIMVHEQFDMGSNSHLQGQLIVQSAATCSTQASGEAIKLQGNATLSVPAQPPVSYDNSTSVVSWIESSL